MTKTGETSMVQKSRRDSTGAGRRVIGVKYQVYTIATVALDVAVDVKKELWTYLGKPVKTGSKD